MMMANNDDIFYSDEELSDSELYQVKVKLFKKRSSQFLSTRRAPTSSPISGRVFTLLIIPRAYSAANCGLPPVRSVASQCPRTLSPTRFITRTMSVTRVIIRSIGQSIHS